MNNLLKEIIMLFVTIVLSNVLVEFAAEEKGNFLTEPFKFFGIAFILSIIGGFILNWMKNRTETKEK